MGQFDKLKEQLEKEEWPSLYLFKFIMPSDNKKIAQISGIFNEEAEIRMRPSRNGNYTSISIREIMLNPDEIIEKYEKASKIEGVIII